MRTTGKTRESTVAQPKFGRIRHLRSHSRASMSLLIALAWIGVAPLCGSTLWAAPTTAREAEMVVRGWLKRDPLPLETALGQDVLNVETFADDRGQLMYYVVNLIPSGFVVVSGDDLVEPIIGFASDGIYDPAPESPLGALVTRDLGLRLREVRSTPSQPDILRLREVNRIPSQPGITMQTVPPAQQKWADLVFLAHVPLEGIEVLGCPSGPSDVRVAPLVESKWGQTNARRIHITDPVLPCYNYYTPQWNPMGYVQWQPSNSSNYPSGCVATALAQLMYYHRYPLQGIGSMPHTIWVVKPYTGGLRQSDQPLMRGGDGAGGPYNWADMVAVPDLTTPDRARRAIGTLLHDAGLSVGMRYGPTGSSANTLDAAGALTSIFMYSNAIAGHNNGENIGEGLQAMINPNLDARCPVMLGIHGPDGGHAILADGYGYDAAMTSYHHLNMGWNGIDDCWYNLPEFRCLTAETSFGVVMKCVYNVFKTGDNGQAITGEIVSGRVVDSAGYAIPGVVVTATGTHWDSNGSAVHEAERSVTTDDRGIYALAGLSPGGTYTIRVTQPGYVFSSPQSCTVGESRHGRPASGNKWGVDFVGYPQSASLGGQAIDEQANLAQGMTVTTADRDDTRVADADADSATRNVLERESADLHQITDPSARSQSRASGLMPDTVGIYEWRTGTGRSIVVPPHDSGAASRTMTGRPIHANATAPALAYRRAVDLAACRNAAGRPTAPPARLGTANAVETVESPITASAVLDPQRLSRNNDQTPYVGVVVHLPGIVADQIDETQLLSVYPEGGKAAIQDIIPFQPQEGSGTSIYALFHTRRLLNTVMETGRATLHVTGALRTGQRFQAMGSVHVTD